ncbi:hypothetical protein JKG47_18220 [Acidithiobacillus sp. MC6.1]|nr:hypothetical protein [Acidithiobacillus sp. MC6.1]
MNLRSRTVSFYPGQTTASSHVVSQSSPRRQRPAQGGGPRRSHRLGP